MAPEVNVQAGLYVAAEGFPDQKQYEESEQVLKLLEDNGLRGKIGVRPIRSILEYDAVNVREGFDIILNEGAKLPFLECVIHDGKPGLPSHKGFSGIEAITKELDRLEVLKKV